MIIDPDEHHIVSSLGYVDGSDLWCYDIINAKQYMTPTAEETFASVQMAPRVFSRSFIRATVGKKEFMSLALKSQLGPSHGLKALFPDALCPLRKDDWRGTEGFGGTFQDSIDATSLFLEDLGTK